MHEEINIHVVSVDSLESGGTYDVTFTVAATETTLGTEKVIFEDKDGVELGITMFDDKPASECTYEEEEEYTIKNVEYTRMSTGHTFKLTSNSIPITGDGTSPTERADNECNHFATVFQSDSPIRINEVVKYRFKTEDAGVISSYGEKHRELQHAIRELKQSEGVRTAALFPEELVVYLPKDIGAFDGDGFTLEPKERVTVDFDNSRHRTIVKKLLEDSVRRTFTHHDDYWMLSLYKIVEKDTLKATENFTAHKSYSLSINISESGYAYFSIYPKNKYLSQLTIDKLGLDYIPSGGLQANQDYGRRKQVYLSQVLDGETPSTIEIPSQGNQTPVEYFENSDKISDEQLEAIRNSINPPVRVYQKDKELVYPQELLVVQPNIQNIKRYGEEFDKKTSSIRNSAADYYRRAEEFIELHNEFTVGVETITFDTSVFDGNDEFEMKCLYEPDADLLKFSDGYGSKPGDIMDKNVYQPPSSFNIAAITPTAKRDDMEELITSIERFLQNVESPADAVEYIEYDAQKPVDEITTDVQMELNQSNCDVALFLLPPNSGFIGYDAGELYKAAKKTMANIGMQSQMVEYNSLKGKYPIFNNVALGLIAKSGGLAFTTEDRLPGVADIFIGIDVSRKFISETSNDQISMAAAGMAMYNNGTILGTTVSRPQIGESVGSQDMKEVVKRAVVAYQSENEEKPNHIVIHRDGFMNDDLSEAIEYLETIDVKYDIVEIKKRPSTRILNDGPKAEMPDKGIALINESQQSATLVSWGAPELLAGSAGTPRPIQVSRYKGDTDIETLTRQVYLLSQSHIGTYNGSTRLPITTDFADKVSDRATDGYLVETGEAVTKKLGFL